MNFLVALFGFFLAVQASPLLLAPRGHLDNLDVYVPKITNPTSSSIWCLGKSELIEWENDDAPDQISNGSAVWLNFPNHSSPSIKLACNDFSLRSGRVEVLVPNNIPTGPGYSITLFGDSGDYSPLFQIQAC